MHHRGGLLRRAAVLILGVFAWLVPSPAASAAPNPTVVAVGYLLDSTGCCPRTGTITKFDTNGDFLWQQQVEGWPQELATSPDGSTVWYSDSVNGTITPIDIATDTIGTPVTVGSFAGDFVLTPDGTKAYVVRTNFDVVPVDLTTGTALPGLGLSYPQWVAVAPDGSTAYVVWTDVTNGHSMISPIDVATDTLGTAVDLGIFQAGRPLFTPDGTQMLVPYAGDIPDGGGLFWLDPATLAVDGHLQLPWATGALALSSDGAYAYVGGDYRFEAGNVLVVDTASQTVMGGYTPPGLADPTFMSLTPDGTGLFGGDTHVGLAGWSAADGSGFDSQPPDFGTAEDVIFVPDQAPSARFDASLAPAHQFSTFDASGSHARGAPIVRWKWNFGDGVRKTTSSPTVRHRYTTPGRYVVTVTEVDAAGTSTTQLFTGRCMLRNGSAGAARSHGEKIGHAG